LGVTCSIEKHLGKDDNASFGNITEEVLDAGFWDLVGKEAKAVSVFCTGLKAAQLVDEWERKSGIIVLDTVATVLWDMCVIARVDMTGIKGWGMLFKTGA
jgi:maleate isomerase